MPEEIVNDDPGNHCFGCSPHNEDGLRLRFVKTRSDVVETRYTAPSKFCGPEGIIHGGIQAALLDEVLGVAAHACLDDENPELVTAEFRLSYRRPALVERPVVVRGRLVRTDGRDVYLEGEIIDEEGQTLTTAEARWRRIDRRPDSSGAA
jgi:uncharacterized protein (TIGR00369 family)